MHLGNVPNLLYSLKHSCWHYRTRTLSLPMWPLGGTTFDFGKNTLVGCTVHEAGRSDTGIRSKIFANHGAIPWCTMLAFTCPLLIHQTRRTCIKSNLPKLTIWIYRVLYSLMSTDYYSGTKIKHTFKPCTQLVVWTSIASWHFHSINENDCMNDAFPPHSNDGEG